MFCLFYGLVGFVFLVVVSLFVVGGCVFGVLTVVCGVIIVLVVSIFVVLKLFIRVFVGCWARLFDS